MNIKEWWNDNDKGKKIRHFVHKNSHVNFPGTELRISGERSTNCPIRDTPWSDIH